MMTDLFIYLIIASILVIIGFFIGKLFSKLKYEKLEATILERNSSLLESFKNIEEKNNTNLERVNNLQIEKEQQKLSMAKQETELKNLQQNIDLIKVKLNDFEELKDTKSKLELSIKSIETERNDLKNENTKLKKDEENRINQYEKRIEATNTLQSSLEKEKERLNDERVNDEKKRLEKLKETWSNHEKDVENHIRLVCKNNVISYIEPTDFPHPGKKPDNTIEILNQYIILDAKSPASDDLNNFPKYIKTQTENLKKYTKYEDVKKDIFLVVPSNTLDVINEFVYFIGDYNVYVISKDSIEPIILSLKKIEEYEFADKLSPEERDNICRIIGKFAHTTKRKIQIEQFFAAEFLDILQKSKTLLPREILKTVIEFENAEKLNPPMEKRKKIILTQDLVDSANQLKKEIEIRDIPKIDAKITYRTKDN